MTTCPQIGEHPNWTLPVGAAGETAVKGSYICVRRIDVLTDVVQCALEQERVHAAPVLRVDMLRGRLAHRRDGHVHEGAQ